MGFLYLFGVEVKRLLQSKMFWLAAILCVLAFLPGYSNMRSLVLTTNTYILDPVMSCTLYGSVVWAVFAIYESSRANRGKMDVITDAITSPVKTAFVRLLSFAVLVALVCLLCMLVYLPYTIIKMDYLFSLGLYAASFLIIALPTWIISFSFAVALYQITRRVELAVFMYAALVALSLNGVPGENYFPHWIDPIIENFSDGFSSWYYLRIAIYTRLIWLLLAFGLWFFSVVCLRRYQKGLAGSFIRGIRNVWTPVSAAVLITCGSLMWVFQPIVNHAPMDVSYTPSEQSTVGVSHVAFDLTADTLWGRLKGSAEYTVTKEGPDDGVQDKIALDCGYDIKSITCDGLNLEFTTLDNDNYDSRDTVFEIPEGRDQLLRIEYEGFPQEPRPYATFGTGEINPDNVNIYNACSTPRLNAQRGMPADLQVTLPGNLTPIFQNNTVLSDYTANPDGTKTWRASVDSLDRSIWINAADYVSEIVKISSADVNFVYSRRYERMVNENGIRESLADVLDFCTKNLGPCPWLSQATTRNVMMSQVGGTLGGGIAGEGWVQWSEDIFNVSNLNDTSKGSNAAEVFAHEIIHQWWGGMGVNTGYAEIGRLWSEEGLTVYTTYRLMKEKFGELYARQNYVDKWQADVDRQDRNFYNRHPEILDILPEEYSFQIAAVNQTTDQYSRMPLMILKAEELVGGEAEMDKILRQVQLDHTGENAGTLFTYESFLEYCGLKEEDLAL
jgi:hypothetical protein